jgi:hypothetical protein
LHLYVGIHRKTLGFYRMVSGINAGNQTIYGVVEKLPAEAAHDELCDAFLDRCSRAPNKWLGQQTQFPDGENSGVVTNPRSEDGMFTSRLLDREINLVHVAIIAAARR